MYIRVVLADDHAVFRTGIKAMLEKEDDIKIVGETGSGYTAIKMAEEIEFDVLLLDLSMPGVSGTRVAEQVLQNKPALGIVVLTMHEDEHYLQQLLALGARGYVLKKSTGTELLQALRAVYSGDSYIDPAMAHLLISPYVGKPSRDKNGKLGLLTPREREICRLLAFGHTNAEVAGKLAISTRTVETHRNNIMVKLGIKTRAQLVRFSIDNGLMQL